MMFKTPILDQVIEELYHEYVFSDRSSIETKEKLALFLSLKQIMEFLQKTH